MGNKGSAEKPAAGVPVQPHYCAHDRPFMGDECAWKPQASDSANEGATQALDSDSDLDIDLTLTEGDKLRFEIKETCISYMNVGSQQQKLKERLGLILDVRRSGSNLEAYEGTSDRTPIPRFDLWTNVHKPTDPRRVIEFRLRDPKIFFRLKEMSEEEVTTTIKPVLVDKYGEAVYKEMASEYSRTNAWFTLVTGECETNGQEWTAGISALISMVKHDKPKKEKVVVEVPAPKKEPEKQPIPDVVPPAKEGPSLMERLRKKGAFNAVVKTAGMKALKKRQAKQVEKGTPLGKVDVQDELADILAKYKKRAEETD